MKPIHRRRFLQTLAGGAAAAIVGPAALRAPRGAEAERKPNIIFIMADDLPINGVGFHGQKLIQTPNIDRIAAEGMQFSDCYAGSAVCAPARSTLMTGQHTGHTTVRANSAPGPDGGATKAPGGWRLPLQDEDVTVAEVLKRTGYVTGGFGKWGLGEADSVGQPNRQGFDEWFGYLNQQRAHDYYTDYLWDNQEKYVLKGNLEEPKTDYSHDIIAEKSFDFLRRHHDKPFFLYLGYTIPHAQFEVPDLGPYANKDWPETQKIYAAMVTRMDDDVGVILDLLDEYGIADNTIVFFTSDNGSAVSGGDWEMFNPLKPFRGKKGTLYEGGLRVPMAVRWPGRIEAGTQSDFAWAFWDLLPTCSELGNAKLPDNIDGISVVPTLLGRKQKPHDYLYWEMPGGGYRQAVRMGNWKGVRPGWEKPIELYNLAEDISEENDVADKHPDVVKKIEAIMKEAHVDSPYYPVPK